MAYVRLFAGTLRARQRVRIGGREDTKPTAIKVFAPAGTPRRDVVAAGEMATVRGLGAVRVGDAIGEPPPGQEETARFPRPALEAVVFPLQADAAGSLRAALAQLAEQDPLIDVRQDEHRHEIAVSLYGEVQKEVIQATLAREYGIAADFRETTTVCIERPARVGEADEVIFAKTKTNITGRSSPFSTNPFPATLALRIEPAPPGSGVEFRADVEPRLVPLYLFRTAETFITQMESYVREALEEGLAGWQVTDCRVTMTDCGYTSPVTSAVRLPTADAARPHDRARPRWDVGLRTAGERRARDAGVDGAGRPRHRRPAWWSRHGPVLGKRRHEGECGARCRAASACSRTDFRGSRWGKVSWRRDRAATSQWVKTHRDGRGQARVLSIGTPGSRRSRSGVGRDDRGRVASARRRPRCAGRRTGELQHPGVNVVALGTAVCGIPAVVVPVRDRSSASPGRPRRPDSRRARSSVRCSRAG